MCKVSGLTLVRNAILNGYPIAEVIDNLAAISDEVVVCDGYSTDGTMEYLLTRKEITVYQDHWDLQSVSGLEFANITNRGIQRCTGDYIFYLQADELIHESNWEKLRTLIRSGLYNSILFNFYHIRYDFDYRLYSGYTDEVLANIRETSASIRVIRNRSGIYSISDGFSFGGNISPCHESGITVYHFGYVFLRNILNKMINHANYFYHNAENYARRRSLAQDFLARIDVGETVDPLELQKILEPEYELIEHNTSIPSCMERLRGATFYTLP